MSSDNSSCKHRFSGKKIAKICLICILIAALTAFIVISSVYLAREQNPAALTDVQRQILLKRFDKIDFEPTGQTLKREISAKKPLHIVTYYGDETGVETLWSQIPEDIREISLLMLIKGNVLAPGNDPSSLIEVADKCDELNIPYAIQMVNGETHMEWLMPLKWIEEEFCRREYFYGVSTAELYNGEEWRGQMDGDLAWYINDAIRLMAKYGEFMFFTDTNIFGDHGTFSDWIEENEYLYTTMKECNKHIFMQNKESYGDPSSYSVMKGLYMAGLIGGWGVATDWWHWQVDGHKVLFNEGKNNIDSEWERIYYYPENMQVMSLAMVAANGGFCFKNEAELYSVSVGGKRTATFQFATIPFLRSVLSGDFVIPERSQLLDEEKFAVLGAENYKAINYNEKDSNLYPCTPEYNIIPLLPANLRQEEADLFTSHNILLLKEKPDKNNTSAFRNNYACGDTYMTRYGDSWLYINNSENKRAVKTASAKSMTYDNADGVTISASEHTYAYFRQSSTELYFQINNYRLDKYQMVSALNGSESPQDALSEWITVDPSTNQVKADSSQMRKTIVTVYTDSLPDLTMITSAEQPGKHHNAFVLNTSYDAANKAYTIEILHNGFVEFTLGLDHGNPVIQPGKDIVVNEVSDYVEADYGAVLSVLEEYKDVFNDSNLYSETSYAAFRKEYSLLDRAAKYRNVSKRRINQAINFITDTPLVEVDPAVSKLKNIMRYNNHGDDSFDRLLRAVLSPTVYYNYKEKSLTTYFWTRKEKYNISLYQAKTKEIAKYSDF